MRKMSGVVKHIGDAVVYGKAVKYSVIEIGEEFLKNIQISPDLHGYVQRQLGEETSLYISGRVIIGVGTAQAVYHSRTYSKMSRNVGVISLAGVAASLLVNGFWFFSLPLAVFVFIFAYRYFDARLEGIEGLKLV